MKSFLLTLVLCRALSWAWPILHFGQATEKDTQLVEKYLDSDPPQEKLTLISTSQSNNVSAEEIQQMQEDFGPATTSDLDLNTLDVMQMPRCGVSDLEAFYFSSWRPKWHHTNLTYRIVNYTPDMAQADVKETIERAFKMWSDVTPLTFKEIFKTTADIMISFAPGVHSDYEYDCPFDGKNGVLAHSFLPGSGVLGDIHFDESENWTKTKNGTNLYVTASHEIGHALGLLHSTNPQAVMFKNYVVKDPTTFRLHQDDIDSIQALYGRPEDDRDTSYLQDYWQRYQLSPGNLLALPSASDFCNMPIDAVTTYKGKVFFFSKRYLIMKDPRERDPEIARISTFWPLLKCGIDSAYEAKGILYFFKGIKYWTFNEYISEISSPKFIKSLGFKTPMAKIDAAFYDQETKNTMFFSGEKYWRYDGTLKRMSYPAKIADLFPEVGSKVDSAFQLNGRLYLLTGQNQYEFDSKTYRLLDIRKTNTWFGCQE